MARTGVTQDDVNSAADQLLYAGERPTIERVRGVLGTGSPNTLIRLLDVWWRGLSQRLQSQALKLALPGAPPSVEAAATALWEHALEVARTEAERSYDDSRNQLDEEMAALDADRALMRQTSEELAAQVEAARRAEALANTRLADASRLVEQQAAQLSDLTLQRDAALTRTSHGESQLAELRNRLQDQETAASLERERHSAYIESVENRAGVEIDRARQEARAAHQALAAAKAEQDRQLAAARRQYEEATARQLAAQQDAVAQRARADALDRHQSHFDDLATAMRGVLVEAKVKPRKANKLAAKKRSRVTSP